MKASTRAYKIKEKRFEIWRMKEKLFLNDGQILRLIWNEIRFLYDDFESYILRDKTARKDDELRTLDQYLLHLKHLSRSPFIVFVWLVRGFTSIGSTIKLFARKKASRERLTPSVKKAQVQRVDIIICSGARFDERPRKNNYIARILAARGHRVFFIEPRFATGSPRYLFAKHDEGIHVINLSCPREFDISFHKISKRESAKIERSFNLFSREFGLSRNGSVLIGHPFWKKILTSCRFVKTMCPDETGTDYHHFAPASKKADTCTVGLCWIKRPVLGILGGSDNTIDGRLLDKIAAAFPHASIVIEGRVESEILTDIFKKHRNIFPVGEKSYSLLPKFLQTYDICIMPYLRGRQKSDPQELYDYLSAGKAIVTSRKPLHNKITQHIYASKNEEEFIANVKKALKEKGKVRARRRQRFAMKHTWERRIRNALPNRLGWAGHGHVSSLKNIL